MTVFTGQAGTVYSVMSHIELATAPSSPLPPPPLVQSLHAPQLVRTPEGPGFEKRLRFNFDILSTMVNSLTQQGYITRTSFNPEIWQLTSLASGVTSFNGRSGAVTLDALDVVNAFGPQDPWAIFAGPIPGFRYVPGLLFTNFGPPLLATGYPGAYYLDLGSGTLYQNLPPWTVIYDLGTSVHLVGSSPTPTAVTGDGAGAGATVSITGNDMAGVIELTTDVADIPDPSELIVEVTFAVDYGTPPVVQIMPANDAAWDLIYGIARLRQADTTGTAFQIRSGAVPLPATTAQTYVWNYQVIGLQAILDGLYADDDMTFLMADDDVTYLLQG